MIGKVWWDEEPEKKRIVTRYCKSCQRGDTRDLNHIHFVDIVSPQGIGHKFGPNEFTACGKDATGEEWWWRY
jgi:hypothetical protein